MTAQYFEVVTDEDYLLQKGDIGIDGRGIAFTIIGLEGLKWKDYFVAVLHKSTKELVNQKIK